MTILARLFAIFLTINVFIHPEIPFPLFVLPVSLPVVSIPFTKKVIIPSEILIASEITFLLTLILIVVFPGPIPLAVTLFIAIALLPFIHEGVLLIFSILFNSYLHTPFTVLSFLVFLEVILS